MFWSLTPWQFRVCVEAYSDKMEDDHKQSVWLMYHGAIIPKMKKIPPLKDFLTPKKAVQGIDENAIMARLKAYNERASSGNGS